HPVTRRPGGPDEQRHSARSSSLHDLIDERVAALLLDPVVRYVFHDADDAGPVFRLGRTTAEGEPSAKGRAIGEELPREALIDDEQAPAGDHIRFFIEATLDQLQSQRVEVPWRHDY